MNEDFENILTSTEYTPAEVEIHPNDVFVETTNTVISSEIEPTNIQENIKPMEPNYITIHANFSSSVMQIEFEIQATGYRDKIVVTNKELRLLHGRFYFIPVDNSNVDTDELSNIKVFSDMARLIDVRYIKNGYACVLPLIHNITISDGQRLAVVW